mgnify:CR=1 FL=1
MERIAADAASNLVATDLLSLRFDERTKSRGKALTDRGIEIEWFLDRGLFLRNGDVLQSDQGQLVAIVAAPEKVSLVTSSQQHLLLRAAYHLGNRHIPLQVEPQSLRFQPDHVLDEMVVSLGLELHHVDQAFQPEDGAYHGGHKHD